MPPPHCEIPAFAGMVWWGTPPIAKFPNPPNRQAKLPNPKNCRPLPNRPRRIALAKLPQPLPNGCRCPRRVRRLSDIVAAADFADIANLDKDTNSAQNFIKHGKYNDINRRPPMVFVLYLPYYLLPLLCRRPIFLQY